MNKKQNLKRLLKATLFILIVSSTVACTKNYVKPQLPSNLRSCDPLVEFKETDFGGTVLYLFDLIQMYKDCNAKSEAKNVYFEEAP